MSHFIMISIFYRTLTPLYCVKCNKWKAICDHMDMGNVFFNSVSEMCVPFNFQHNYFINQKLVNSWNYFISVVVDDNSRILSLFTSFLCWPDFVCPNGADKSNILNWSLYLMICAILNIPIQFPKLIPNRENWEIEK